jgi:ATP-dependent exoDNAse (exonuclease V) beta subunit
MNYQFDNNSKVNLNGKLLEYSKAFLGDVHYEHLKANKNFDIEKYIEKTKFLRKEIEKLQKESLTIAEEILQLLEDKELEISDFAGGKTNGLAIFFSKLMNYYKGDTDNFPIPGDEGTAQKTFANITSATGKKKKEEIEEILDYMLEKRDLAIQNYIQIQKSKKILYALLPLKVNKDIQDELAKIEEENDLVFLSKFNTIIKENLQNEPSAFIYEKIGTKFQYFFFDEFQDTSDMQWQNFVPLRDHSVSMDDTSFTLVGDPKQSIYRFRGGDSKLMLNIINHHEASPKFADLEVLENNWRSAKNIVEFNNALYEFHAEKLQPEHKKIFGTDAKQIAKKTNIDGRVRVNLLENATKTIYFQEVTAVMHLDIQTCLDNGFSFSDITILCRGNAEISTFSQLLGSKKIKYRGEEVYINTISEKGLTLNLSLTLKALVNFLQWKTNTQNKRYLAEALYWLKELGRIEMMDFSTEISALFTHTDERKLIYTIQEKYNLNLDAFHLPQLNLYNFIEYFLKEFSVAEKETDFILNFLELLHGFTQSVGLGLKDFLVFWNDEGKETSILASENIDAINLMTIHKAKGLEFPIVFLPMRNASKEGEFSDWYPMEDEVLSSVYINQFSKELTTYDENLASFNEVNVYDNKIDALCTQYVATTRPVEQLFFYIEKNGKTNNLDILDFIEKFNPQQDNNFDIYDGNFEKKSSLKKSKFAMHKIDNAFPKTELKSTIAIATPSKNYQTKNEKVKKGIFIHEILSKIYTEKEVASVLENYLLNGLLSPEKTAEIQEEITNFIHKNMLYFDENLEVYNERDILFSDAYGEEIYRPDRLMKTKEGQWMIVDFKTGERKEEHQEQIAKYQNILQKLGYPVSRSEVLYL